MDILFLVLSLLAMLSAHLAGSMADGAVTSSSSQDEVKLMVNMCLGKSVAGDSAALSYIGKGGPDDDKQCGCTLVTPPNTTLHLHFTKPIYNTDYDQELIRCLQRKNIQSQTTYLDRLSTVSQCVLEINIPDTTATFQIFQRLFMSCNDGIIVHNLFNENYMEVNLAGNQQTLSRSFTTDNTTQYIHINYSREGAGSACLTTSLQATQKLQMFCGPGNTSVAAALYVPPTTQPPLIALYKGKTLAAGEVWAILGGITIFFLFCVIVLAALYIMREHKGQRKKRHMAGEEGGKEIVTGLDDENLKALRSNAKGHIPDQALMEKTEIYETLRMYDIQAIRKQLRGELEHESNDDDFVKKTKALFKKKKSPEKKATDFSAYKDSSFGSIYDMGRNPIGSRMQQTGIVPVTRVPKKAPNRLSDIMEDMNHEGIDPSKASFRYEPRYLNITADIHASGASIGHGWETTDSSASLGSLRWTDVLPVPEDQRSVSSLDSLDEKKWRFQKAKKKDGAYFFGTENKMNIASTETLSKQRDLEASGDESEDPYKTLSYKSDRSDISSTGKLDTMPGRYVDEDPYNTLKPLNLDKLSSSDLNVTPTGLPPYPHGYDNSAMESEAELPPYPQGYDNPATESEEEKPSIHSDDNLQTPSDDEDNVYHSLDDVNLDILGDGLGFEDHILQNPNVKFNTLERKHDTMTQF